MKRFYQGIVVVQVHSPGKIDQHNEMWHGLACSKEAALGEWAVPSLAKHPGGVIAWMDAYDITDGARSAIAAIDADVTPTKDQ